MGSVGQYTQGWFPWQASKTSTPFSEQRVQVSWALGLGILQNAHSSQNDVVSWDAYCDTGTWKYCQVYYKDSNGAINTIALGSISVGTIDHYSAAGVLTAYAEITGISVVLPAVYNLTCTAATRNASSGNWQLVLESVALIRTSGTASTPGGTDTPGYTWQHFPWMGVKSSTGTWVRAQDSASLGGGYWQNNSVAQNDETTTDVWLDSGTYKFALIHIKGTGYGITTFKLDGSSQGTIDAYAGSTTYNNYSEVTGITLVAPTAARVFQMIIATKNASAGSYALGCHSVGWYRTGA